MIRRIATSLLLVACGGIATFGVPASLELLRRHETWEGTLFAFGAIFAMTALVAITLAVRLHGTARAKVPVRVATILSITTLGVIAVLAFNAPNDADIGKNYGEGSVRALHLDGVKAPIFSLARLLPELDQVALGISVAGIFDPHFDRARTERLRAFTMPLYREMRADPAYNNVESAMSYAYQDVWSGGREVTGKGHAFEIVPPSGPGERLPVLLFLHGSVGNFLSYLHVLRRLAHSQKMIIVCPTNGFGDWDRPGAHAVVERMLKHIREDLPSDDTHLYIAGISAGGFGATHAAATLGGVFRGVILLSPIFDRETSDAAAWSNLPVFIAHGIDDERVSNDYVDLNAKMLEAAGAKLSDHRYPGEDHFLFYSKREEILTALESWLAGIR